MNNIWIVVRKSLNQLIYQSPICQVQLTILFRNRCFGKKDVFHSRKEGLPPERKHTTKTIQMQALMKQRALLIDNTTFALAHNGVLNNDKRLRRQHDLPATKIETDSYIPVVGVVLVELQAVEPDQGSWGWVRSNHCATFRTGIWVQPTFNRMAILPRSAI